MRRVVVALIALVMLACASHPKARIVTAYQAVEIGLGAVQDAERAAYQSGAIPALTREVHETKIAPAFVKAFDMQITVGKALLAWQPGTTLPVGFDAWVAAIEQVAVVMTAVSPKNGPMFDATVAFVTAAVAAIRGFGQAPSAALLSAATP